MGDGLTLENLPVLVAYGIGVWLAYVCVAMVVELVRGHRRAGRISTLEGRREELRRARERGW